MLQERKGLFMSKKLKRLPKFKSEQEEREFWSKHDATDYFDTTKAQIMDADTFHGTLKPVTIRFSSRQLDWVRKIANGMDVGYQSLIKVWIDERLLEEKAQRGL